MTMQKRNEAAILLAQAKEAALNECIVFIANLNAFMSAARSVTLIMQKECNSIAGFKKWYEDKQRGMKDDKEFEFFNGLRIDTVHVRPFNMSSTYTTKITGGLSATETVEIPLGRVDGRGNIEISDQEPAVVDGKPVHVPRSTSRSYFFEDKPEEDAVVRCQQHLEKLDDIVNECHRLFLA